MVRVVQVADKPGPNTPHKGGAAQDPSTNERTAQPGRGAKRAEAAPGYPHGGFEIVRGCVRDQVHRAAHGVAAVERTLGTPEYFHALDIQKIRQHHDRPRDVDAVDIERHAGIGPREHDAAADPPDGELRVIRVLRERQRRREAGDLRGAARSHACQITARKHADGNGRRLHVTESGLRRSDGRVLLQEHRKHQVDHDTLAGFEPNGSTGAGKPVPACRELVRVFRERLKLVPPLRTGRGGSGLMPAHGHRYPAQRRAGGIGHASDEVRRGSGFLCCRGTDDDREDRCRRRDST